MNKWLFNPASDLLFCCGGLVFLLVGIHYLLAPSDFQSGPKALELIPFMTALGTILLSDTHNAATLFRLYGNDNMREKHRFLAFGGAGLAAVFCSLLLCSPPLMAFCARVYLLLVVYHVLAQLYGISLMYCRMHNYILENKEKLLLKIGLDSLALYAVFCQFVYVENFRHSFFGVSLPVFAGLPRHVLYTVLFVSVSLLATFAATVVKKKKMLPLPVLILLSTGILIASIVHCASGVLSLYIPIFFHGLQYLMINLSGHLRDLETLPVPAAINARLLGNLQPCVQSSNGNVAVLYRSQIPGGKERIQHRPKLAAACGYFGNLLILTFCIFAMLPQLISLSAQIRFETAFLAVFLAINFHHIVTDSVIWRKS